MLSFQQIVGTTTAGANPGSFADLTQNNSAQNVALGATLCNNQHRYLIQKYFDNERTYTTLTIGAQSLLSTATLSIGDVSATLTTTWTSITSQQLVVFSSGEQRTVTFTQNSTNIFWQTGLTKTATTTLKTIGVGAYPIPANVSKIKNDTITVGQLVYTPAPVNSIQEWTLLTALPYTSDIPNYFFIYQNQVNFWPIPSSSNNLISFNYKSRVPNLTYSDYSVGTIAAVTAGSNIITGGSTVWSFFPNNVDLTYANLMIQIIPPSGDGFWYPIQRFTSATSVTLNLPVVNAPSATATNYTIGQFPLLQEDFHDMIVYGALLVYFGSIKKDPDQFKLYKVLYDEKLDLLKAYAGTKSVNVDLGAQPIPANPNLFIYAPPQG